MKKDLLIIAGLFILIIALLIFNSSTNIFLRQLSPEALTTTTVKVGNTSITADVAKTPQTRSKGLSGRENLATNSGLLLVFDSEDRYRFWMKDVKFPIDIIWISADKQIVDITHSAQPEIGVPDNLLRIYQPAEKVKFVLEVPAGTAAANNFRIGDKVDFSI